jgi:hypothetical protein
MFKKYDDKEIYPMITLVLHYPEAGHTGRQFWTSMMSLYGDSILASRNAGALREKWRKIAKDHSTDLPEYKKELTEGLPKEFVDNIEKTISKKMTEPNKNPITSKRRSSHLPNIFKGEGIQKMKLDNGKKEELVTKKTGPKKPSLGRIRIGHDYNSLEDIRNSIDLNSITARKAIGISKTIKRYGYPDLDSEAKDFLSKRNENALEVQRLTQLTKNVEVNTGLPKLPTKLFEEILKADEAWSELEDLALRHIELPELQAYLLKARGSSAIEQRKKLLGI